MSDSNELVGLVLPAGGARAAYQVGVLKYLGEAFTDFNPRIFVGVSAGSINASYLAQGQQYQVASKELYALWQKLEFSHVFKTNFKSLFSFGTRWMSDLFLSKITRRLLVRSVLDASPLASSLLAHIHFWKISRAIRDGNVWGLAVSTTNYHVGNTTVFYDSHIPIQPWLRESRIAIRTAIRIRHIMASCSIPILFEPVRIGDALYGDGALRFSYPLSPAIHLGATRIIAIGNRSTKARDPRTFHPTHVTMGFVAGAVLNSIFMNSLETDFENVTRMNRVISTSAHARQVPTFLLKPSEDLGLIASNFLSDVPFHLRQLLNSTSSSDEMGDLLSYLMFSHGYLQAVMALGMKDAEANKDEIRHFLDGHAQAYPAAI